MLGTTLGDASEAAKSLAAAATVTPPDTLQEGLPNPLVVLPILLRRPMPHRIATIHGDLNLENVLVDPSARTVRLIDFSHSREDHVLHDLLRLETGLLTRLLPARLAEAGLAVEAVIDLMRRLHTAADAGPPAAALSTVYLGLVAIRKAATQFLFDESDWREYYVGLAAYLVGAGKYRNLDAPAKAVAFWAAAAGLGLAEGRTAANADALDRAIPVLLERNPVLDAYRRGRIVEWSGPRYELDERFVALSLLVDQGEESVSGRWQAKERRYPSLRALIEEVPDPALVVLGSPGSGKSTLLRHLELDYALAGLEDAGQPLTFFMPLSVYKAPAPGAPAPPPRDWLAVQWSARHPKLPPLEALLAEGRMILLLDALNEMPAASAAEARERVGMWKDFAQDLAATAPGCRLIFSCRSLDYSTPLSTPALRVPQVRVEPLGDDDVRCFLDQYAAARAEGLWETLAGSGHLDVVRSPYFLRLLVEQVEVAGEVPLGRAALFTGFVRRALAREVERDHPLFRPDSLLAERDVHRLVAGRGWRSPYELPERGVLLPKLAELAYRMQERGDTGGEQAQVRLDFDSALGLLAHPRDADIVAAGAALGVLEEDPERDELLFVHQLVQEYFAARVLAALPRPELVAAQWQVSAIAPSVWELIEALPAGETLPPLPQTGWEETTLLAVAMTDDAEGYLQRVMDVNLALAGRCAAGAGVLERLGHGNLDALRWALVRRSREAEADLRDRIACAVAVGELRDPRFERREGPHGPFLMPPLVDVPGGVYPVGEDEPIWDPEVEGWDRAHMPRHGVIIAALAIARYLVTNAEWRCFLEAGGYEDEQWWASAGAREWRRGEGTAEGPRQAARRAWRWAREDPRKVEAWRDGGQIDDETYQRWQRRLVMTEAEFEVHLTELYPGGRLVEPRNWQDERYNAASQPVTGVCWYEARAYCHWLAAQTGLAFRLPSEVEWEAAARGASGRPFACGAAFDALKGNILETRMKRPTPVGVFPEGDTPEGVCDLAGNVAEWTSSLWGEDEEVTQFAYPYDAGDGREDLQAPGTMARVVRGGSWYDHQVLARAAFRFWYPPGHRDAIVGFRVAVAAPAKP